MKKLFVLILLINVSSTFSQTKIEGTELGIDGFFGASTYGGSFGIGVKYGFKLNENFIFGPSIRYQRYWSNNVYAGTKFGFNSYGVGGFAHGRFGNMLFAGAELEFMRSPINNYGAITGNNVVSPSFFVGGGFSREFNESIRINAGLFYDVINNPNSPFRQGYFMKRANGSFIPLIYRICFFFPLS